MQFREGTINGLFIPHGKYFPLGLMVQFPPLFLSPGLFLQRVRGLPVCKQAREPPLSGLLFLVAEVPGAQVQVRGGGAARGVLHPLRLVSGVQLRRGPVLEPSGHPALHDGLWLKEMPPPSQLDSVVLEKTKLCTACEYVTPSSVHPPTPELTENEACCSCTVQHRCFRSRCHRQRCEELTPCMQPCIYSPITWSLSENEALHMGYDVTTDHTTDCSFNGVNGERDCGL